MIALEGGACGHTPRRPVTFAAIDFETADRGPDSACAVAVVRVVGTRIVKRARFLIRPPRRHFVFSSLHDITWADVADAPAFHELWPSLSNELDGVDFLAAHNASFDQSVLTACCDRARIRPPGPHSDARSPWRAPCGPSTRRLCPTCAVDSASRCTITIHCPMPRPARRLSSPQQRALCDRQRDLLPRREPCVVGERGDVFQAVGSGERVQTHRLCWPCRQGVDVQHAVRARERSITAGPASLASGSLRGPFCDATFRGATLRHAHHTRRLGASSRRAWSRALAESRHPDQTFTGELGLPVEAVGHQGAATSRAVVDAAARLDCSDGVPVSQ